MAFDNKYPNRKDKRRPFRGAKAVDTTCRNHGSCRYCRGNRQVNKKRIELAIKEELKTFGLYTDEGCLACLQSECRCIEEYEEMELSAIEWLEDHKQKNNNILCSDLKNG